MCAPDFMRLRAYFAHFYKIFFPRYCSYENAGPWNPLCIRLQQAKFFYRGYQYHPEKRSAGPALLLLLEYTLHRAAFVQPSISPIWPNPSHWTRHSLFVRKSGTEMQTYRKWTSKWCSDAISDMVTALYISHFRAFQRQSETSDHKSLIYLSSIPYPFPNPHIPLPFFPAHLLIFLARRLTLHSRAVFLTGYQMTKTITGDVHDLAYPETRYVVNINLICLT